MGGVGQKQVSSVNSETKCRRAQELFDIIDFVSNFEKKMWKGNYHINYKLMYKKYSPSITEPIKEADIVMYNHGCDFVFLFIYKFICLWRYA